MEELPVDASPDPGVLDVVSWFQKQKDWEIRFGTAIRRSLDEVIDGGRTKRYRVEQLAKTEKTYIGTKIEILVGDEFNLDLGGVKEMDYVIAGHAVDCKWTLGTAWTIPSEALNHLCLLVTANDAESTFSVAVARMTLATLSEGTNKDGKRRLTARNLEDSAWLSRNGPLPENMLLRLDADKRQRILDGLSGQARVNELFRQIQNRLVTREVICTVATQLDPAKRVRDARLALSGDGISIFGHLDADRRRAAELGLPQPVKGEWISTTVNQ